MDRSGGDSQCVTCTASHVQADWDLSDSLLTCMQEHKGSTVAWLWWVMLDTGLENHDVADLRHDKDPTFPDHSLFGKGGLHPSDGCCNLLL